MPQAIVDPSELRRFAHNLKRFNGELEHGLTVLHGQLVGLSDTWRDQEHLKFVESFEQTMQSMQRFVEASNLHIPFLLRKAERIEEYLQQKQEPPMSESARVTSIAAIQDWKEALCVFRDEAVEALGAVELEIRRAFDWLEAQTRFWQTEVRRREELVLQAKNELTRRKMLPIIGKNPDTTEQEKNLRKAQQRLREAEEKLEAARKMAPLLRRAVEEYEGPGRRMSHMLDAELPRSVAVLERRLDALDAYLGMRATAPAPELKPPAPEV